MPERVSESSKPGCVPSQTDSAGSVTAAKDASILSAITEDAALFEKARLLQSRAAEFGFDWPSVEPVFEKLQEEIAELKAEISQAFQAETPSDEHRRRMQDELGDVLFCCVNLARFMRVDAAKALQGTNEKFERRFRFIELAVHAQGRQLTAMTLKELDQLWDAAKAEGL